MLARGQRLGIELDAHGVLLRAEHLHLGHAADHGDALRHQGLGVFVHVGERQRGRARAPGTGSAGRPGSPSGTTAGSACSAAAARAALAMARLHVLRGGVDVAVSANCSVICVAPSALMEVIESRPAMVENCFSSGVATAEAMVSGLAPGRLAVTRMVGKSTLGRSLTGKQPIAHDAEQQDRRHDQRGHDRPLDEEFGKVHGLVSCACRPAFLISTLAPAHQAELAVGHDLLPGAQARLDHRLVVDVALHFHRPRLRRQVRLHHEDELTLLSGLDGLRRHHDGIRLLGQGQRHVDELPRPQAPLGVRKRALQLDGPGVEVHLIVDEGERPYFGALFLALDDGGHLQLALRHVLLDLRQRLLRHGKGPRRWD